MESAKRWDGRVEGEPDPNQHAQLIRMSNWGFRPIEWFWEPLIPKGKVTLLAGEQEMGKTFFTLDLAARLSRGESVPPAGKRDEGPGNTLILTGDDDLDDTLYPRLFNLGAELERVYVLSATGAKTMLDGKPQITLADSVERLHNAVKQMGGCELIIIDPITAFIDGMSSNHSAVRRLLARLTTLARIHNAAALIVSHNHKRSGGGTLHRTIGSLAFTIASRAVLTLVEDPTEVGRRFLLPAKMNLRAADTCHGRAFRFERDELRWDAHPIHVRPDELHKLTAKGLATSERVLDVAEELREKLAAGPIASVEMHAWAIEEHIPRMLLFQAKAMVGIESKRDGKAKQWSWRLPSPESENDPLTDDDFPDYSKMSVKKLSSILENLNEEDL